MRGAVCNSLKWGQWTAGAVATSTSRLFNSHISLSSPQRQGHGILVRAIQQSQWRNARRRWWQRWGWPGEEREGSKWPKSHFSSTKSKFPKRLKHAFFCVQSRQFYTWYYTAFFNLQVWLWGTSSSNGSENVDVDNDEFVCFVPFDPYVLVLDVGYLTTPRQTGQIRHCRSFALKCA